MSKAPTAAPTPVAKNAAARTEQRTVFAIRKTIVYTIHGTSSNGLPCKEKKQIEILKFLFCRESLKYFCTKYNNGLFQYYYPICD